MLEITERREVINESIIKALLEFKVPWRGDFGFPRNIISKLRYDGVNPFLLNLAALRHGWKTPYWGSTSQWLCQGFSPKTRPADVLMGDWSQKIVLYKLNDCGKMELGRWGVFNLDQIENSFGKAGYADLRSEQFVMDCNEVDRVIESVPATVHFKPTMEAAYYFQKDEIIFPLKWQFVNGPGGLPAFYNSLFHELVHWTEPRLSWNGYPPERELRAEIGADYLCTELNIPRLPMSQRTNHVKFLPEWVQMMRNDPELIFRVSAAASKAVDLILSFSGAVEPRHNPPQERAA